MFSQRGGPGRGLSDGTIGSAEIQADSVGLTALADPVRRRTTTIHLGTNVTAADNWPVMRAGAEAPQITGCYVNAGVQMYHAAAEGDTWAFQLRNVSRGLALNAQNASLSNLTLTATAYKSIPMNNGNSTLTAGETLQFQLTESGTAQTIDQLSVMIEWQPTVNL